MKWLDQDEDINMLQIKNWSLEHPGTRILPDFHLVPGN